MRQPFIYHTILTASLFILVGPCIALGFISDSTEWRELSYPTFQHENIDRELKIRITPGSEKAEPSFNVFVSYSAGKHSRSGQGESPRSEMFSLSIVMSNGEFLDPSQHEPTGVIFGGAMNSVGVFHYVFHLSKTKSIPTHLRFTMIDTAYMCEIPACLIKNEFPSVDVQNAPIAPQHQSGIVKTVEWERISYDIKSEIPDISLDLYFINDKDDFVTDLVLRPNAELAFNSEKWNLFSHRSSISYEFDHRKYHSQPVKLSAR